MACESVVCHLAPVSAEHWSSKEIGVSAQESRKASQRRWPWREVFPREEGAPTRETQFFNWLTSETVSGAAAKGSTATGVSDVPWPHGPRGLRAQAVPTVTLVCCYPVLSLVLRLPVHGLT